jgi:hypothetical protein
VAWRGEHLSAELQGHVFARLKFLERREIQNATGLALLNLYPHGGGVPLFVLSRLVKKKRGSRLPSPASYGKTPLLRKPPQPSHK